MHRSHRAERTFGRNQFDFGATLARDVITDRTKSFLLKVATDWWKMGVLPKVPTEPSYLLSSSVLCSTAKVRTLTFSGGARGRLGVMRLTAAVLRKRFARPSVGELSQLGRARAPPIAAAPNGRCDAHTHTHAHTHNLQVESNLILQESVR